MKKSIAILVAASLVTGCAGTGANFAPLVDGGNTYRYQQNLAECQAYADQLASAGDAAVVGAVFGAGLGLLLAVVSGGTGDGFGRAMAGAGAVGGAVGAAGWTERKRQVARCARDRGAPARKRSARGGVRAGRMDRRAGAKGA